MLVVWLPASMESVMKRTAPSVIKRDSRLGDDYRPCRFLRDRRCSSLGQLSLFGGRIVLMLVYNVNEHAQRCPYATSRRWGIASLPFATRTEDELGRSDPCTRSQLGC